MAITTNGAAGSALTISADLAATISDESGTGAVVFNNAPTLTNAVLTTPTISTINAKGDVLVGTADNTLGVLTVGTDGYVLTADSTVTPSGLKWAAASSGGVSANDQAFAFAVQVFA
jgi:hypothetical protein